MKAKHRKDKHRKDKRSGNAWVFVGIVVVAAIAVLAFVWRPQPSHAPTTTTGTPVNAPKGQLVAGFPPQLILDSSTTIASSYSINYSTSTNQYTAQWNSTSGMASLYTKYKQYLPANGWKITNDNTSFATIRGLYATKDASIVNVTIVQQGTGSQVTVSYVAQ